MEQNGKGIGFFPSIEPASIKGQKVSDKLRHAPETVTNVVSKNGYVWYVAVFLSSQW